MIKAVIASLLFLAATAGAVEHYIVALRPILTNGLNAAEAENTASLSGLIKQFVIYPATGGTNVMTASFYANKGSYERFIASIVYTGAAAHVSASGTYGMFGESLSVVVSGVATSAATSEARAIFED